MSNTLEERLKTHSTAFDGLLSLIPAKYYYDDATQDQWQKKKKAKKEASENRLAKLDPESGNTADSYNTNGASAKDIMDKIAKSAKKVSLPRKIERSTTAASESEKSSESQEDEEAHEDSEDLLNGGSHLEFDDEGNEIVTQASSKTSKAQGSKNKKELSTEELKLREQKRAELKEKLAKKISLLREKRKAPGTKTGGPVKSREQMLEERKRREEVKKQEKLKRKRDEMEDDEDGSDQSDEEDDEDDQDDDEAEVLFGNIQFADGSRMTSDLKTIRNGADHKKKKGPANKDIKAHLSKLENKKRRLESLTPEQRKQHEEKDQWSSLMSQAEGVKIKNDEKLLRKALKKKEKQKLKSEIEWRERKQVVKDTISARQKRRDANLKARKDNKGKKSKNQPKLRKFTGVVKKGKGGKDGKKRAGFEGNAKSKGKQKD
ncbi:hypothetical protein OXX80_011160 [Metschnikowia pulcherrima]